MKIQKGNWMIPVCALALYLGLLALCCTRTVAAKTTTLNVPAPPKTVIWHQYKAGGLILTSPDSLGAMLVDAYKAGAEHLSPQEMIDKTITLARVFPIPNGSALIVPEVVEQKPDSTTTKHRPEES